MKKLVTHFFVVFLLGSLASFAQEAAPTVDQLAWMAGCWQTELNGEILEEHWSKPAGATLVGFSRVVDKNETVFIEFSSIHTAGADVFYTATLVASGQSTPFKLAQMDSTSVLFRNPEHDFPQTIFYRLETPQRLFVRIEGDENGEIKSEEYLMNRISCQ